MGILTEMVRDNFRATKTKVMLLPALGELLYLIASQEDGRATPGLAPEVVPTWSVSPNTYTQLRKCLRGDGEEAIVNHLAAKIMENVACTNGVHAQVRGGDGF
jgi:serine/threonine-protein kinase ULK4